MEYPTQNTGNKIGNIKKVITVSILVLLLLTASLVLPIIFKQITTKNDKGIIHAPLEQKVYTQEEKTKILEDLTKSVPTNTVSPTEQVRVLKKLQTNAKLPSTTPSVDERLRILQMLEASAGK